MQIIFDLYFYQTLESKTSSATPTISKFKISIWGTLGGKYLSKSYPKRIKEIFHNTMWL